MTLTVLNENTQGSGVSAISVNDMGISSFEQVDLSSGSLVATFFPGQVPLNLPGRGIATLEVNVQKLNLLKNSTLSVKPTFYARQRNFGCPLAAILYR